jgi:hypothetical protein
MAIKECPPGAWTDIDAVTGDMLLEARGIGFYVDTTGTKPANPAEGYALASNHSMVIKEGLAVAVYPAQPIKSVIAVSNPV